MDGLDPHTSMFSLCRVLKRNGPDFSRNRGTLHGFQYYFFDSAAAQKQDREARDGLRWLLSVGQTS